MSFLRVFLVFPQSQFPLVFYRNINNEIKKQIKRESLCKSEDLEHFFSRIEMILYLIFFLEEF